MTNSLQDLIDASIFISTEYQARLAELIGSADYDVNFAEQSLTFKAADPVSFQPYLLGTESENRGTWIWSWQQLGYFPNAVVSAALQARDAGERDSVLELSTDEIPLSEGLARRLTLATKTVTGLYAHYPLPSGSVRAWSLIDSPELTLDAPTYKGVGRVIAKALQSEDIHDHPLAVNSYARQRGFHTAWDTEATVVLTMTDGALRLWFDEGRISGIERAKPEVTAQELAQLAAEAEQYRAELAAERTEVEQAAAAEAAEQVALREQQSAERAAARAEAEQAPAVQEPEEAQTPKDAQAAKSAPAQENAQPEEAAPAQPQAPAAAADHAVPAGTAQKPVAGVRTTENLYPDTEAPFDQDPREDSEHGRVTVNTLPGDVVPNAGAAAAQTGAPAGQAKAAKPGASDASKSRTSITPRAAGKPGASAGQGQAAPQPGAQKPAAAGAQQQPKQAPKPAASGTDASAPQTESTPATAIPVIKPAEQKADQHEEQEQTQETGKKKGFFSRFFGL
ncbi:hydrolase [Rothia sp. HMSC058E10]|uniref:DUF6882 domain-containing protein n=1 Tax=Rothia TaxID=32207 RepID=UPI0008A47F8E|nr:MULTISPECIES: DUF6882 domain-containing protein [Rothia]OFN15245.1 hydrolase [Rothia sp. HMSC058E10]OFQ08222.1 hydrolase [Rothia sp. HMSC036D11]